MTIPKPDVPGGIIRFIGRQIPRIPPSAASTVAVPLISDWGPIGSDPPGTDGRQGGVQLLTSFPAYTTLFGDSDTEGRTAVAGAFSGQGLVGAPGAGGVLAYRMAGSAAAYATITLVDRQGSPANALTLRAIYKGTRGNRLTVTVDTDPNHATRDRLRILLDNAVQETYLYDPTDVATLTTSINRRSRLVQATNLETGPQRLAATSGTPLAGGDDGATLANQDHLDALAALELKQFGILAPYDVTDPSLLAAYASWRQAQEDANKPVRLVVGGVADETIDDALTRSATLDDPHVINVGVGTWHYDLLDKDLSTAQLAPLVAGILAAKGEEHSITFAETGGLRAVGNSGPAADEIRSAVLGGVVTFMPVDLPDAEVQIVKGVTTFTTTTDTSRPVDVFSDARLIGIMDDYIRNMKNWGDRNIIGKVPVNDDSRAQVRGEARRLQSDLLGRGLILPGDDVNVPKPWVIVDDPEDPDLLDAIPYTFGWQFAYTANAILGEGLIQ